MIQQNSDYAKLKFYAYRHVLPRRDKRTPSAIRNNRRFTWAQWFEKKYGEPFNSYHQRVMARRLKQGMQR